MGLIFIYLMLCVVVGVAANTRGRSGLGWFVLALVISPLVSGLLVLALPRIEADQFSYTAVLEPPSVRTKQFVSEGVLKGIPYRSLPNGRVEAAMAAGFVIFPSWEQFKAAAEGRDVS